MLRIRNIVHKGSMDKGSMQMLEFCPNQVFLPMKTLRKMNMQIKD